jgi:hypothetical protein
MHIWVMFNMLLATKLPYSKKCQMDCMSKLFQQQEFQLICLNFKVEENLSLWNCISISTNF